MFKNARLRLLSCLLVILFAASCAVLPAAAASDQDKAQISVRVSNNNPEMNEIITVTVSIDNYPTMSPRISAMYISVSFDTNCFEYVPGSAKSVLKTNTNDITSVSYDESENVSFAYVYANAKKSTLPTTAKKIFEFNLKVKTIVPTKTETTFSVNELTLYNGKNDGKEDSKYTLIECREPSVDEVTVWQKRPVILINGNNDYASVYSEDVTITFDAPSASLSYEGRSPETIYSPYNCNKNGRYTVTVMSNGQATSVSFEISKEISNISVKAGTYKTEYALGITPDYSGWILLVTYRDGSHSEIGMDDPDITITGYQPNVTGSQRILIKYKNQSTSVNVNVTAKSVESITIRSNISKTEYLVGDDIDTEGGTLIVFYDDGSSDDEPITQGMLSYDKTYVGEQTVTVTYGNLSQQFKVIYYSRDAVDSLINDINNLDLSAITLESKETITDLFTRYAKLNKTQQDAVITSNMLAKLQEARAVFNNLVTNANKKPESTSEKPQEPVSTKEETPSGGSDLKIVWYIVAGIVIVSVIGGIIYFIYVYSKKKKELDEDEYYYEEDDDDDDGSLSYDDLDEDEDEDEQEDEDDE